MLYHCIINDNQSFGGTTSWNFMLSGDRNSDVLYFSVLNPTSTGDEYTEYTGAR
jgi:hypothetical protein